MEVKVRGNLSQEVKDYILELKEELDKDLSFENEIVTIDDQIMTVGQAIRLLESNELTSRTYGAHKK